MTMVPIDIQSIKGTDGQVRMPDIGVLVGYFSSWHMSKQGDGTYLFRGTFAHVNATLWAQDYRKTVTVKLSREKAYQLCQDEGRATRFEKDPGTLEMEGVRLCLPEEASKP
jgi:hypothetical protein